MGVTSLKQHKTVDMLKLRFAAITASRAPGLVSIRFAHLDLGILSHSSWQILSSWAKMEYTAEPQYDRKSLVLYSVPCVNPTHFVGTSIVFVIAIQMIISVIH